MRAPLLLILAALLCLAMQLALGPGADSIDAAPRRPRPFVALSASALPAPTVAALSTDRSPFDLRSAAPGQALEASMSAGFSLIGLIRAGASASAVVRDPSGATHVLRPGQAVGDWRLDGVGRDSVSLSRGADHRTLTLNGAPTALDRTSP